MATRWIDSGSGPGHVVEVPDTFSDPDGINEPDKPARPNESWKYAPPGQDLTEKQYADFGRWALDCYERGLGLAVDWAAWSLIRKRKGLPRSEW